MQRSPLAPKNFPVLPPIKGVYLSTTHAGFKKTAEDLLLITLPETTAIAGIFTTSSCPAASVEWCQESLRKKEGARAIVVNAGNANAFTSTRGYEVTRSVGDNTANLLNCAPHQIFQASTGVIGEPFAPEKITSHLSKLIKQQHEDHWEKAAKAICTTDTFAKGSTAKIENTPITINGIAKGSGMIQPNMATMLAFLVTDACIDPSLLQEMLEETNDKSFQSITVDGDTSTNDLVLLCATGTANHAPITTKEEAKQHFLPALQNVMTDLAQQIVRDGEGAQKFIEIQVTGADKESSAKNIALTIANSPLVKTAIAGEDANWGRIIMAIGKSGATIDQHKISLSIGNIPIIQNGERLPDYNEAPVAAHMKGSDITIHVDLGLHTGSASVWTCDLTHGYISINADYRS